MIVRLVECDYGYTPARLLGVLEVEATEAPTVDALFVCDEVPGRWEIYEFARDAPARGIAAGESRRHLAILKEIGECGRLSQGMILNPAASRR